MFSTPRSAVLRVLWLCIVLMPHAVLVAQDDAQSRLDQLRKKLQELPNTPEMCEQRVNTLCNIGAELSRVSADSSRVYFQAALRLSEKYNSKGAKAQALMCLTNIDMLEARVSYTKILEGYAEAAQLFKEVGKTNGEVSCYSNMGNIYRNQGKNAEAEIYYLKSVAQYESLPGKETNGSLSITYSNLGTLYSDTLVARYPEAIEYFNKALKISELIGASYLRAPTYISYGICLRNMNKNAEGLGYLLKALQLSRENNDLQNTALAYGEIVEVYKAEKEYEKSLRYLSEAETLLRTVEDKINLLSILNKKSEILTLQEQYKEALLVLDDVLSILKSLKNESELYEVYLHYADVYTKMNNIPKANKYKALAQKYAPKAEEEKKTTNP